MLKRQAGYPLFRVARGVDHFTPTPARDVSAEQNRVTPQVLQFPDNPMPEVSPFGDI